jgi:hypothetical protein
MTSKYIADGTGHEVVLTVLEGREILIAFELNAIEHSRRRALSIGAIGSLGLLHALWSLPAGVEWPAAGINRLDTATLLDEGEGYLTVDEGSITRAYQPAGQVRGVGLPGRRLVDAVEAAGRFPPIFRRYAVTDRAGRSDHDAIAVALALGVGAAIARPTGLCVLAPAAPPTTGLPSVYRWWLAEVAYHAWLQTNAH